MTPEQTLENIALDALLPRVRELHDKHYRMVQITATLLGDFLELTYSFDLDARLLSLRFQVPCADTRVPSISPIYGAAILYENEMHDLFHLKVEGMTVDFHGNLYNTAIKYPMGSTKAPCAAPPEGAAAAPCAIPSATPVK